MPENITERFVDFALSAKPDPEAISWIKLSFFDWLICLLAGAGEPVAQKIAFATARETANSPATAVNASFKVPARDAALINGTASHALDFDDTHFAHIGHPSVAVFPAALAIAQEKQCSVFDFLEAALIGAEVSIRIGQWLGRGHYQRGFHQTSTAGSFGALVAVCKLMGLTREEMLSGFGLMSTRASGLKNQFGTMGKPLNAGLAASNGVECAEWAQAGITSDMNGLAGNQGFGATHAGASKVGQELFDTTWRFKTISHKFHACCHGTHAMIEALRAISDVERETEISKIEQITVRTNPRWMSVCNIAHPRAGLEVKFSYAHIAAMVLAGFDTAKLENFSEDIAKDKALIALSQKVRIVADEEVPETASEVIVSTKGGETKSVFDIAEPLDLVECQRRLVSKAKALLGEDRGLVLAKAVLEQETDLQSILSI